MICSIFLHYWQIGVGNPPVKFPAQSAATQGFDGFFAINLNKDLRAWVGSDYTDTHM